MHVALPPAFLREYLSEWLSDDGLLTPAGRRQREIFSPHTPQLRMGKLGGLDSHGNSQTTMLTHDTHHSLVDCQTFQTHNCTHIHIHKAVLECVVQQSLSTAFEL